MSFAELKRARGTGLDKCREAAEKLTKKQDREEDDRFWRPGLDKSKNGSAVIRFLPAPDGEDVPWIRLFSHGFKGPNNSWYIENSLTTLNQKDPVSDYNTVLWNSGIEANKNLARAQKRRLHFISNILVIKDPSNPENEGKVFLFKYGKKIFDKVNEAMHPTEDAIEEVVAFNPFDFWGGANFKLRVRFVEGYLNYDKSEFSAPSPLSAEDSELEAIWKKEYLLSPFLAPSNFKSYDELKSRLEKVIGPTSAGASAAPAAPAQAAPAAAPKAAAPAAPAVAAKEVEAEDDLPEGFGATSATTEDEDDDLSYVKRLAEDD